MWSSHGNGARPERKHAPLLHISDKSTFGEADRVAARDHEVIEGLDVDQRQRLMRRRRQQFICAAGPGEAGRIACSRVDGRMYTTRTRDCGAHKEVVPEFRTRL